MLDTEIAGWVESRLGRFEVLSQYAHDHGYSRLWRLRAGSDYFWLKMHTYPAKAAGEIHALIHWAPALGLAPSVVAWRDEPRAVILTERPGHAAEKIELDLAAKIKMWEAAGDWLRRLHLLENAWLGGVREDGTPWGGKSQDPVDFVLSTFTPRLDEGEATGLLTKAEVEFARFGIREWVPALAGEKAAGRTPGFHSPELDVRAGRHACRDHRFRAREVGYPGGRNEPVVGLGFPAPPGSNRRVFRGLRSARRTVEGSDPGNAASAGGDGSGVATQVNDPGFAQHNRDSVHRMMAEHARAD